MTTWLFDLPNFTSGNPLSDLAVYSNTVTANAFWSIILFFLMIVSFALFSQENKPEKSLLGSLAIGGTIGFFLSLAGLVSQDLMIFIWLGAGLNALWVYYSDRR